MEHYRPDGMSCSCPVYVCARRRSKMTNFDDIRPYRDNEVRDVIERLLNGPDLIHTMLHHKFPNISSWAELPLSLAVRWLIKRELKSVNTVHDFQTLLAKYLSANVKKTTSGFTSSGLDQLDPTQNYTFISNHRDIAMDPAFLNMALHQAGRDTVEIAIGDNLLAKPLVSDLMRLNKSFTVQRSVQGIKNKYKAFTNLSSYINSRLEQDSSIWIAQREGRAKDGVDKTDPAIIKMLTMFGKKKRISFSEAINKLNIVPVSISYEFDPCDLLKAEELQTTEQHGQYEKAEGEDVQSIINGISKPKGQVHVSFGTPITGEFETAEAVADLIDLQVLSNYQLHVSNLVAFEQLDLKNTLFNGLQSDNLKQIQEKAQQALQKWRSKNATEYSEQAAEFTQRIQQYPQRLQSYILVMYANPLIEKYRMQMESMSA